jgi:proline iminopeptidase
MPFVDGLFYDVRGRGPVMIAVHGGMGWDSSYLTHGLNELSDIVSVTYVDLTGNGQSRRPSDPMEWNACTIHRWTDDVEQIRRQLGTERIVLFGHSMGAAVAQEYALANPSRVSGLILTGAYAAFDYGGMLGARAAERATPEQLATLAQAMSAPMPDDETLAGAMRTLFPIYFHRPENALATRAFATMRYSAGAFNRGLACLPAFSTVDRLATLDVPTLVINGGDDWIGPVTQTTERFRALLPRGEVHVLKESGHFPFLEEPAAFERIVRDWLRRVAHIS